MFTALMTVSTLYLMGATETPQAANSEPATTNPYTVAAYYFPNYHPDPRNAKQHGEDWTEWELVKQAEPRFDGHHQPNIPLWGYTDESNPEDMAQKIAAAADHGIDVFIFDWYWYDDGPFLERGLEKGFMKAPNRNRLKFALMWANHNWIDIHPARLDEKSELLYPGTVTPETFEKMTDYIIETYFKHPCHWLIDGCPYFSVYELHTLVKSFGSLDKTREALARFRAKTKAAGFPDLHLNAVTFGVRILPGETAVSKPEDLVSFLGFDSVTSYVWIHHVALPEFPETPYEYVRDKYVEHWKETASKYSVPYYPNVTMGWDASPRCHPEDEFKNRGYPFMATISGNTPEAFESGLRAVQALADTLPEGKRIVTINCWNEWTEGSYLEPDTRHGFGYLEAIQRVFGGK
ncbi:MAG: glycoside hydrolase family 99-like domain-containing protein [Candidatus Hydrogenedentota bacterium]